MNTSITTLCRRLLAFGIALTTALLSGCGGGGSDSGAPTVVQPGAEAIVTGAQLGRSLGNKALVGQAYKSRVAVVPNDARNSIIALTIANPTPGGATPTIDTSGAVTWTPNEADFASTLELIITATLREGSAVILASPVRVRKERLVHQEQLPANSDTIADPNGRYLIQVEPEVAGTSMSGTISISEVFSANGSFVFVVRVPVTSGARVKVLDAPETSVVAPRAGVAGSSGRVQAASLRERPMGVSPGLTADVGRAIDADLHGIGRNASENEVDVFTTRNEGFYYTLTVGSEKEYWSAEVDHVFQIDAQCTNTTDCRAAAFTRGPVILIHGFNPWHSVGGGEGTWGSLANALKASGHPVFELRWTTYMRFEEAAGTLSALSTRVAEITGRRVTVVAHSFGGIVAHLSMMGMGIRYQGDGWHRVPVDGVFQRLITLGSPLSGIRQVVAESYGLTAGRDDDDISIAACEAITCFQAGSSAAWGPEEIDQLTAKLTAIDPGRTGLTDAREGETIRTLHEAWKSGGHAVPFATVVSLKKRPVDYPDPLTNATAFDLGDGLISVMGQSVLPQHFSARPFGPADQYDILGTLGADFLTRLDSSFAAPMVRVESNGFKYFFALRAAHSCAQRTGGTDCVVSTASDAYLIANYPVDGLVDVPELGRASHPLRYFIESQAHLDEPPANFGGASEAPLAVVRGSLVRAGLPLAGEGVSFQIIDATTGLAISQATWRTSGSNGEFTFDAGRLLAERFPGRLLNVADYEVLMRAGTGLDTARESSRRTLAAEVALGVIDLTPVDARAGVSGRVIDGQTQSQPLAGANVYLMKGTGQSEQMLQVRDTTTSRRLTTDALGRFWAADLQPGLYSAMVTKTGYLTQTQGSLVVSADGSSTFTFSLLKLLAEGEAAITLRWGAATDGALVSRDLDSHLLKFDSSGIQQYEIAYYARRGSASDSLDRDDTDYQGPETITLGLDSTARYVYFVHNYVAGNGSLIGPSRPTVSVRAGQLLREFSLPPGEAGTQEYWKVFEIVNGAVVPCAAACLTDAKP